jgi:alpha-amylase
MWQSLFLRFLMLVSLAVTSGACRDAAKSTVESPAVEPRDWRDEIIYQLLTDRFANGDPSNDDGADTGCPECTHGGDWRGIIDKLDYLEALGVTAVWISPLVENIDSPFGRQAYHGYWPLALDRPNLRFGSLAELQTLVEACHGRGIKVIADVIVNHMGAVAYYDVNDNGVLDVVGPSGSAGNELSPPFSGDGVRNAAGTGLATFTFFADRAEGGARISPASLRTASAFHRRGTILDYNDGVQVLTGDFKGGLRDIDTSQPEIQAALEAATLFWTNVAPFDGFRFDAAKHVEDAFWQRLLPKLREHTGPVPAEDDGFIQFAEVFDGRPDYLATFTGPDLFDSILDFGAKFQVFDEIFKYGGAAKGAETAYAAKEAAFQVEPHPGGIRASPRRALLRFLDNHDMPRFLSENPNVRSLRAALGYLLLADGVPVLYYGTEQELAGGVDPANREDLWLTGYDQTNPTFQWLRRLIALRKSSQAIRRGDTRFVWASAHTGNESDAGILAFERVTAGERLLVIINTRPDRASETTYSGEVMQVGFAPGTLLENRLEDSASAIAVAQDGTLRLSVPACAVLVLGEGAR